MVLDKRYCYFKRDLGLSRVFMVYLFVWIFYFEILFCWNKAGYKVDLFIDMLLLGDLLSRKEREEEEID